MGNLPFLEDIYPRHLLYGITIRSPVAKGYLELIQFPKLPDDYLLITARNIPGENKFGETNMPVFADSDLSYIGEPVGLLLGPDKIKLEYLASKCLVLAKEEEPEFDFTRASSKSIIREIETGNPGQAFEKDDLIITSSYSTGIQDHWYAEPSGAITLYNEARNNEQGAMSNAKRRKNSSKAKLESTSSLLIPNSSLITVKTATQYPYHVKHCVSRVLDINPDFINVEQTELSLHMDGKLWFPSLLACHAAIGTYLTKKPVRLILNREEDFFFSPKRSASNIGIAASVNKNGKISALKMDISVNLGAYEVNGDEIMDQICKGAQGIYKIDNLKLKAHGNHTNLPSQGPFSGFGLSQGLFAIERQISLISEKLGIDPVQCRKENSSNEVNTLIDQTTDASDYFRKWSSYELLRNSHKTVIEKNEKLRGIGIAVGFQGNGLLHSPPYSSAYSVEVTLTKESMLEIKTYIASSEDYNRIWEKIAMETISIKPDMVKIIKENAPDPGPSCSSRNITHITKLVEKCCRYIGKQRFRSPLPITVKRSVKPQDNPFAKPGYACAVVEVSIDPVECIPKIRGVWLGVDGGKIISKNRAKRALVRGSSQALGWAFTENIEYINGALTKYHFENFSIPSPAEIPPIQIDFLENEKVTEPKGIGELPFTCIPAAFLQAVSQAMDHSFKNIPLKRENIWEFIRGGIRSNHGS